MKERTLDSTAKKVKPTVGLFRSENVFASALLTPAFLFSRPGAMAEERGFFQSRNSRLCFCVRPWKAQGLGRSPYFSGLKAEFVTSTFNEKKFILPFQKFQIREHRYEKVVPFILGPKELSSRKCSRQDLRSWEILKFQ